VAGQIDSADGVFEGGGVKGLAFAGAIRAAEDAGIHRWVNVAGTSAGSIVAALLAGGFDARALKDILWSTEYREFADYGRLGLLSAARNALTRRGLARGEYLRAWLEDRMADSELGVRNPTFEDVARDDLPDDLPAEQEVEARYRLRVIASDITAGRMLVLPQDIEGYTDAEGVPYEPGALGIVDAVRMSMSFPFFFEPVTLHRRGSDGELRPHLIVDGGILSNFPVWLFDNPGEVRRPTFGFKLHRGAGPESPPYREIPRILWPLPMAKAMFFAATEAWDRRTSKATRVRTVSIPTAEIKTLDFDLGDGEKRALYDSGHRSAETFFDEQTEYLNSFGRSMPLQLG
jgi:NTE family protein